MVRARSSHALLVAFMLGFTSACISKPPEEPLKVASVELGLGVDDAKRIQSPGTLFSNKGEVWASVTTEGSGQGTLAARWTDVTGKVVAEQTQAINPTGAAHFEFHFIPPDGWPTGRHTVVFTLNGTGTRSRDFETR